MRPPSITPEAMERPFDPENVLRYNFNPGVGSHVHPDGVIVRATDYDSLLASYRALQSENSNLNATLDHAAGHAQNLESENRIAMRALEMAVYSPSPDCGLNEEGLRRAAKVAVQMWLAEARIQEGLHEAFEDAEHGDVDAALETMREAQEGGEESKS